MPLITDQAKPARSYSREKSPEAVAIAQPNGLWTLGLTVGGARAVRLASRGTLKQANWASAIELDPGYVDTAVERWQRMTGQPAVHANGKTFDEMRSERLA